MIRLPQYSKLRSQPQQAFLWVNLDEEEERTGLYIPNSTTTKSAAHRSSRLALSKLLMKGFTMSDKISPSGYTCYGALNPTFTAQPFHVHKFPRCKFEVVWELSHCGLCANLNKLGFSPQQNLEIHKKMGMSDEQLEAYEKQEREVCVLIP